MRKELKFRSLDELIDTCRVDLKNYSGEGQIEVAELIKVALKCNYQLGLQIQQTKETVLDIEHGRAKLPADFDFLNFAFLCHHYRSIEPSIFNGLTRYDTVTSVNNDPNITTCPCWTVVTSTGAQVTITYCDGTKDGVYFPPDPSGSGDPVTTKLCAMLVDVNTVTGGTLTASTTTFCYNDTNTGDFTCTVPDNCNVCDSTIVDHCAIVNADPWKQNRAYTICNGTVDVKVIQHCQFEVREFSSFEQLYVMPSRQASAFCTNKQFKDCRHYVQVKDGFIQGSLDCGKIYLNYEGVLEGENGELLVLDHPEINSFYEYSIKQRIVENLYFNGEPDIERRLQLIDTRLQKATLDAMTIAFTPDFQTIKNVYKLNRENRFRDYLAPFDRFFGPYPSQIDYLANGRNFQ